MKIAEIELFLVPPRWLFLKITTDDGIVGWGEPVVEGHAATVATAVREAAEYLLGRDPNAIEDIWQTLYRGRFYRGGPVLMSAIAGIDQALWDIKGKRYGVPIYELLGGRVRERVRVYSWIGGDSPHDVTEEARQRHDAGFSAIKMNATGAMEYIEAFAQIDATVARVASVREALGRDFGIAIDFHGRVHRGMAKLLLRELEPLHPLFVEEPVLSEHWEALRDLAQQTTIPIATGERLYSRWDVKQVLSAGGIAIIQPDPSHAGGISEVRRIAALAEAYDVAVAPHCPLGPIALAAAIQLDAAIPNAFIQEQSLNIHYNTQADLLDYLETPHPFLYKDGYVAIPDGPGLGITVNEPLVRRAAETGHTWRNPVWHTADGAIAEW